VAAISKNVEVQRVTVEDEHERGKPDEHEKTHRISADLSNLLQTHG